jgi:hypothetical protein
MEKLVVSDRLIGVVPRVTEAPLAVRVIVPQDADVPTPTVVPQLTEEVLVVREAAVPDSVPDPAVPSCGVTVKVSASAPGLPGVKLETVTRLQLLPEARVWPTVQAPLLGVLVPKALVLPESV